MRRRSRPLPAYRALLECGREIWLADSPITSAVKYGCNMGLGCGYRLNWLSWWHVDDPDSKRPNRGSEGAE